MKKKIIALTILLTISGKVFALGAKIKNVGKTRLSNVRIDLGIGAAGTGITLNPGQEKHFATKFSKIGPTIEQLDKGERAIHWTEGPNEYSTPKYKHPDYLELKDGGWYKMEEWVGINSKYGLTGIFIPRTKHTWKKATPK